MKNMIKQYCSLLYLLTVLFFTLSLISCKKEESDAEKQAKTDDQKIQTYLTEHSIQATKHSSGFYYEVISSSAAGDSLYQYDVVDFYYKISLLDGTVLEEVTPDSGTPARFNLLSSSMVPAALDPGIKLMKIGDQFRFYIPSNLAYGSYSCSLFPAYSIFIIDVEVFNKQSITAIDDAQLDSIDRFVKARYSPSQYERFASGLYYIDSVVGIGAKPFNGNAVTINYTRKYLDGTIIKTATAVSFYLGYGYAVQGLEEGIEQMHQGGTAILVMPASIAFQQSICVVPQSIRKNLLTDNLINVDVLPYSMLEYIVVLQAVF
jgi:peptidylprolyl isomerase